jgi:hypothetical protein
VTSSPVTAFTRCGPASAIEPWPETIGTKSMPIEPAITVKS